MIQPLKDSAGQPFKPLARWHVGLEEWVLTTDRAWPHSEHVTVRRADGSTYHAAWDLLHETGPESLNARPAPFSHERAHDPDYGP